MQNFTEHDRDLLEVLSHPVKWAEATLKLKGEPFRSRWYQTEVIDHILKKEKTSNRIVLRFGRRLGKTTLLAVFALWFSFTNNNGKILFAAPYDSQVALFFKMVREFLQDTPELEQSIKSNTKNPQYIEFKNGSTIAGFTSGTKSGAKGDSMRGQAADWIFLDEADRLSDDDIDSITAVALEDRKRIGIWATSTPTGRRGKFYTWCHSPKIWGHFHHPSSVNPTWDEEAEAEFRALLSPEGYVHEVLAEFGEESVGVFKKKYIDRAKEHEDYDYVDSVRYPAIRTIGVDFDKYGAATQIIVVEFDKNFIDAEGRKSPKFRVIHRTEIPMSEFTLDNAVEKIKELNKIFQPAYIYCDRGYGEYQIETLHKYGMRHPDTLLHKRVKGFAFNQSVPVRDPHTKEIEKKPLKPFMVNQAAIILERDQLLLNPTDQLLWKQMEDYQVVRKTTSGQPVYTSENEHALDALMLALLAFSLEYPDITKILQEISVARRMAIAPRLKHGEKAMVSATEKKEEMFDPDDPEERRGHLVKRDRNKKNKSSRIHSWGLRGTGPIRQPKKRTW